MTQPGMSDPDEMDAALAAEIERRIGVAEDRRDRLAHQPAKPTPPAEEDEDDEHDCVPPFCDHPSHDDGPDNDDWIADAYERQAQWRQDR